MTSRLTAFVHGNVQGVGFRWWTKAQAIELGLVGSATNLVDGRVCVVAEGPEKDVRELHLRLSQQPSAYRRPGTVDVVIDQWGEPKGERGFLAR